MRAVSKDKRKFEIGLKVNEDVLVILIELPKNFPNEAPKLSFINAVINHPWVDDSGRIIGANGIYSWRSTSLVVDVVKETLDHFIQFPPKVVKMMPKPSSHTYYKKDFDIYSESKDIEIPRNFEEITALPEKELNGLLEDNQKFDSFFEGLKYVQDLKNKSQVDIKAAQDTLKELQDKEIKFNVILETNKALKHDVKALHDERTKLISDIDNIERRFSKEFILEELTMKMKELDTASNDAMDSFMIGKKDPDLFLKNYLSLRHKFYIAESQTHLLRTQNRS